MSKTETIEMPNGDICTAVYNNDGSIKSTEMHRVEDRRIAEVLRTAEAAKISGAALRLNLLGIVALVADCALYIGAIVVGVVSLTVAVVSAFGILLTLHSIPVFLIALVITAVSVIVVCSTEIGEGIFSALMEERLAELRIEALGLLKEVYPLTNLEPLEYIIRDIKAREFLDTLGL